MTTAQNAQFEKEEQMATVYAVMVQNLKSTDVPALSKAFLTQAEAAAWIDGGNAQYDTNGGYVTFYSVTLTVTEAWKARMKAGMGNYVAW
jgi:hypothetical protein